MLNTRKRLFKKKHSDTELRKLAAQKAYYSLQGTGLKHDGVKLDTAIKIYRTAVERMFDTIHCKHLKNIMGLK